MLGSSPCQQGNLGTLNSVCIQIQILHSLLDLYIREKPGQGVQTSLEVLGPINSNPKLAASLKTCLFGGLAWNPRSRVCTAPSNYKTSQPKSTSDFASGHTVIPAQVVYKVLASWWVPRQQYSVLACF